MKRTAMVTVLGFLICLCVAAFSRAQVAQPKAPQPMEQKKPSRPKITEKTPKLSPANWKWTVLEPGTPREIKILLGFDKTHCAPDPANRKPEVAIMDLTEERYAAFRHDPKTFVNSYHFFSCPVREVKSRSGTPRVFKSVLVTINHEPDCAAYYY